MLSRLRRPASKIAVVKIVGRESMVAKEEQNDGDDDDDDDDDEEEELKSLLVARPFPIALAASTKASIDLYPYPDWPTNSRVFSFGTYFMNSGLADAYPAWSVEKE